MTLAFLRDKLSRDDEVVKDAPLLAKSFVALGEGSEVKKRFLTTTWPDAFVQASAWAPLGKDGEWALLQIFFFARTRGERKAAVDALARAVGLAADVVEELTALAATPFRQLLEAAEPLVRKWFDERSPWPPPELDRPTPPEMDAVVEAVRASVDPPEMPSFERYEGLERAAALYTIGMSLDEDAAVAAAWLLDRVAAAGPRTRVDFAEAALSLAFSARSVRALLAASESADPQARAAARRSLKTALLRPRAYEAPEMADRLRGVLAGGATEAERADLAWIARWLGVEMDLIAAEGDVARAKLVAAISNVWFVDWANDDDATLTTTLSAGALRCLAEDAPQDALEHPAMQALVKKGQSAAFAEIGAFARDALQRRMLARLPRPLLVRFAADCVEHVAQHYDASATEEIRAAVIASRGDDEAAARAAYGAARAAHARTIQELSGGYDSGRPPSGDWEDHLMKLANLCSAAAAVDEDPALLPMRAAACLPTRLGPDYPAKEKEWQSERLARYVAERLQSAGVAP
jgi:hypothetical protein